MPVEVRLTAVAGEYMATAVVQEWLVQEGQPVAEGAPLVVVETAKANVEIPAPATGVLQQIVVARGDEAPVGALLAVIASAGERAAPPATVTAREATRTEPSPKTDTTPAPEPQAPGGFVRATPRARALARELGVPLARVTAAGGGVVSEEDVRRAASAARPAPRVEQLEGYRRAAAEHMARALEVPQFSVSMTFDATRLDETRAALKRADPEDGAVIPSVTEFVVKAAALALRRHPRVNARWEDGRVRALDDVNVGVAVATDRGLVVPVLRAADTRALSDLAAGLAGLRTRAEAFRLAPEDVQGGTFTVSNLGMFGVEHFTALVNPPQAAILAVSAVTARVVWVSGEARPQRRGDLTLTADHRVIDGMDAARFLGDIKALLEQPDGLLA